MLVGLVYDLTTDYIPAEGDAPDEDGELNSPEEIDDLANVIRTIGHEVVCIGDLKKLVTYVTQGKKAGLIFNYAVGKKGCTREAQVPSFLEAYGIPYTGADSFSLALCVDKAVTKQIWQQAQLPTASFICAVDMPELIQKMHHLPDYPLFIKPNREGTSKGISEKSVLHTQAEFLERAAYLFSTYRQPVIIETYLPGREFSVGILGSGAAAHAIGVVEVVTGKTGFADYLEKKTRGSKPQPFIPVQPDGLKNELMEMGLKAYRAVGCQEVGRVDIKMDQNEHPNLIEINPNPTLAQKGCMMADAARFNGMSFNDLILEIINMAKTRWAIS